MFGRTKSTCLMPFSYHIYDNYSHCLGRCILYILLIFLFHLGIIPLMVVP